MALLIISFTYGLLGVVPAISQIRVLEIVQSVLTFLGVVDVVVDPTTAGLADSNRAMSSRGMIMWIMTGKSEYMLAVGFG